MTHSAASLHAAVLVRRLSDSSSTILQSSLSPQNRPIVALLGYKSIELTSTGPLTVLCHAWPKPTYRLLYHIGGTERLGLSSHNGRHTTSYLGLLSEWLLLLLLLLLLCGLSLNWLGNAIAIITSRSVRSGSGGVLVLIFLTLKG